jgi:hypothetical protein
MICRSELVLRREVEPMLEEERRKEERWSRDSGFVVMYVRMIVCNAALLFSYGTEKLFIIKLPCSSLLLRLLYASEG